MGPGNGERVVGHGSVQRRVLTELREMIVSGTLEPGGVLSEQQLSEELGVSRTPVREAFKQLESEGLVEIKPRVGTFVTSPSMDEVDEMSQVREVLEGLAASLMARNASSADFKRLGANVSASEKAVEQQEIPTYVKLVSEFHRLILEGSDNRKLVELHSLLVNQFAYRRLVHLSLGEPGRPGRSLAEHRMIFEMISVRDAEGADRAMRHHVRSSHMHLMRALDAHGAFDA